MSKIMHKLVTTTYRTLYLRTIAQTFCSLGIGQSWLINLCEGNNIFQQYINKIHFINRLNNTRVYS